MHNQQTYLIDGKRFAAVSLAQAMLSAIRLAGAVQYWEPPQPTQHGEEMQQSRRTQPYGA